ncbi:hypothetical protein BpHYR1_021380 [Brachionus plicatilis]|uniref:Uncharacterized protein n=1 Tax=Brachionus plicatilis TaxID=10195 RepID=A0A3M7R7Q3_BRAPC|nr:hypothetical protein BpHYR1_021380 [Brachionus plicatilis]
MSSTYFGPEKNKLKNVNQRGEQETITSSINFNLKNIQKNNKIDKLMTCGKKYAFPSNVDSRNSKFSNNESNNNIFNLVDNNEYLNDFSSRHSRGRTRDAQNQSNTCTRRSVSLINYLKENIQKDSLIPQNLNNHSEFTVPNQRQFNSSMYRTNLEENIILSQNPVACRENGIIKVNDVTGTWINRDESLNWKGVLPLDQYALNNDPNPIVVKKKPLNKIKYTQEINVKYLKPPKIPDAGDIIIRHDAPRQISAAPSLIIRKNRPRLPTPPPLVIREEPPKTPETIPTKVITIPGKLLPPPPRKLIIEKMPQDPQKPQSILIERWLPYNDIRRRVIYQKPTIPKHLTQNTKNVIIDWQKPDVQVTQELKYLGIEETNPSEYRQKYWKQLNASDKLPEFVHRIEHPHGIVFASQKPKPNIYLEGDIDALDLIDLDQAGLTELKEYIIKTNKKIFS